MTAYKLRNRRPDGTSSPETTIVSARLTPAELAALDAQRRPGETRTDVVRRLLVGTREAPPSSTGSDS